MVQPQGDHGKSMRKHESQEIPQMEQREHQKSSIQVEEYGLNSMPPCIISVDSRFLGWKKTNRGKERRWQHGNISPCNAWEAKVWRTLLWNITCNSRQISSGAPFLGAANNPTTQYPSCFSAVVPSLSGRNINPQNPTIHQRSTQSKDTCCRTNGYTQASQPIPSFCASHFQISQSPFSPASILKP